MSTPQHFWCAEPEPGLSRLAVAQDDQTYIMCVLTLEELGATGNLGLSQIALNPVIAAGIGGLATSATAQATVEVCHPAVCMRYLGCLQLLHVNA